MKSRLAILIGGSMMIILNSSCQTSTISNSEDQKPNITMNSMDQRSDFEPDSLNLIYANLSYSIPKYDTIENYYKICLIGELNNGLSDTTLRKFPSGEINFKTYYINSKEILNNESYARIVLKEICKKDRKDTSLAETISIPMLYGKWY